MSKKNNMECVGEAALAARYSAGIESVRWKKTENGLKCRGGE